MVQVPETHTKVTAHAVPDGNGETTMARKMIVTLTDDLTGEEIPDNGGQTVTFALDGKVYEVDLTTDNAKKMRDELGRYVNAGRMVNLGNEKRKGTRLSSGNRTDRDVSKVIRAWARSQGETVPERGRIPAALMERWEALSGTEKALAVQSFTSGAEQTSIPTPAPKAEFTEATGKAQAKTDKATTKADTPKSTAKEAVPA